MISSSSRARASGSVGSDLAVIPFVLAAVAVLGLGGGYLISVGSMRTVAAAMVFIIGAIAATALSVRTLATGLLLLTALTAGMNTLRLDGAFTVMDAFIFGAAILLLPSLPTRRSIDVNSMFLAAGSLLVVGALLGAMSSSEYAANLGPLVKLVVAVFLMYAVFLAWAPTARESWLFVGTYVGSACLSSLWGIFHLNPYTDRAAGLTVHPNHLALISVLALGPAIAVAFAASGRISALGAVASIVLLAGIIATGSRAGLVGAVVVILLAIVLAARDRVSRLVLLGVLGFVIFIPLFVVVSPTQNAVARLTSNSESARASDIGRRQLISQAIKLAEDHPLTGAGLEAAKEPHDIFLGLLSGGGPIALLGALMLVAVPFRSLAKLGRRQAPRDLYVLIAGLSFGALGFFAACLFQNTIWDRYIWLPVALLTVVAARLDSVGRMVTA